MKEKLTKKIKVGLTNDEYYRLKKYCRYVGISMSEFIRRLIWKYWLSFL